MSNDNQTQRARELEKNYADLIVELCDDAETRVWTEGTISMFGYKPGIKPAFKRWWEELRRAAKVHKETKQAKRYQKWWNKPLGRLGRTPLTRRSLASRERCPRSWALNL